jgi:hypothetical protein
MMREITVEFPRRRGSHFSSADAAIEYARAYNQLNRNEDERLAIGSRVVSVIYADEALVLSLDNSADLTVGIEVNEVVWSVRMGQQCSFVTTDPEVLLKFPSLDTIWRRDDIAKAIAGQILESIFVTPDRLLLYFSRIGIIAVCVLLDASTREPLLFWDHSE